MSNYNQLLRARQEAIERRTHRNRADRYDGLKPQIAQWMEEQGYADAEQALGMEAIDDHAALNNYMANEGELG